MPYESLPGNGENNDSNLPVKTHATAYIVPVTESILGNKGDTIPTHVPTVDNEEEDCQTAHGNSNNTSTVSMFPLQLIGAGYCSSGELHDKELSDASVPLDWNNNMDHQVLDWSFNLWGKLQSIVLIHH